MPSNKHIQTLEERLDIAWMELSLDAPQIDNPVAEETKALRTLCQIVHIFLPTTKLYMGFIYFYECPTNPWVPYYMIIGGIFQLLFLLALTYRIFRAPVILFTIGFLYVIWGIIASVQIFAEWKPDFFIGGWRYCHRNLFYFSFYCSVSEYVIFSIVVLYLCIEFAYK